MTVVERDNDTYRVDPAVGAPDRVADLLGQVRNVAVGAADQAADLRGLARMYVGISGALTASTGGFVALGRSGAAEVWPEAWIVGVAMVLAGVGLVVSSIALLDRVRQVSAALAALAYVLLAVAFLASDEPTMRVVNHAGVAAGMALMAYEWKLGSPRMTR